MDIRKTHKITELFESTNGYVILFRFSDLMTLIDYLFVSKNYLI